jgi:hypothetical protein
LIDGQEPEFIKDEQVNPGELCGETREAQVVALDNQLIHQLRRPIEAHLFPLPAGGQRQPNRYMRFTPSIEMPS